MPALNFKAQFADDVAAGRKRCTIRAKRKHPIRLGDQLYFFTGMRTKGCRGIGCAACASSKPITILRRHPGNRLAVVVNGQPLSLFEIGELAKRDGFPNLVEFLTFFESTHGLPFEGDLIEW